MSRMNKKRLGDIVNFKRGYDLPSYNRNIGPYPIISSSGISGYHSAFKAEGEGLVTGRYGTLGEVYYIDGKYWPHNTALYVTDFKGNYPKYVYFLMKCLGNLKTSDKSTVPGVNRNDLHEISVPYIEKDFQKPIGDFLFLLEEKIELNNQICRDLEALANLVFEYWFVQFDFPNTDGHPYKSAGGKFIYNAQAQMKVPEGWEIVRIADCIKEDKSGDWGKDVAEGNYNLQVTCIRGTDINGLNGSDECNPPNRYILEKNSFKVLSSHDIIIEISGGSPVQSTGRLAFVTDATLQRFEHPLICSNFCKAISLKDKKMLYNFIYNWNRLYNNKVLFGYEGKTSGIKNLLFDSFTNSFWIVVPEESVMNKFYDYINTIHLKKQVALTENQRLYELRNWLLPMLITGQIKISETKQLMSDLPQLYSELLK